MMLFMKKKYEKKIVIDEVNKTTTKEKEIAFNLTYPSHPYCELSSFAMHANSGVVIWHPRWRSNFNCFLTTYIDYDGYTLKWAIFSFIYYTLTVGTKEYLLFRNKSSMHLFIWAIHSCFSVPVAAYTANDLVGVRISQPFRYSVYAKKKYLINL